MNRKEQISLADAKGASPVAQSKESGCDARAAGDLGLIFGSGRSSREGNGNPLQYYCLENPMDRGALQATVPGVAKSWTQLSDFTFTFQVRATGVQVVFSQFSSTALGGRNLMKEELTLNASELAFRGNWCPVE